MGSHRVIIQRSFDYQVICPILNDPSISSVIYEDTAVFSYPDLINEYWMAVYRDNNTVIGCYRLHKTGSTLYQVHANILKPYRKDFALSASRSLLNFATDSIHDMKKLLCIIPACFLNIEKHCVALGFTHEATIKKSYLKEGDLIDQHFYSLSEEDLRGKIWDQSGRWSPVVLSVA